MDEEEKQSLEIIKGLEFYEYEWYVKTDKIEGHANDVVEKVEKALQTILNLVDKQQKEIEELKDKNKTLEMLLQGNLFEMYNYYKELANRYQANCISKDKIKEKIKYYHKQREKAETEKINDMFVNYIDCLEELLGD